jgi:hypothetical protein
MTLRIFAVVMMGAGLFACLPLMDARACDDDRYPCPLRPQTLTKQRADAPAEMANPSARPTPLPKSQKKVNHPARAHAKGERETPRAATRTKANKPVVQRQADSISQKLAEVARVVVPPSRTDQSRNNERQNLATAASSWPVLRNSEDAGASAPGVATADVVKPNAVQLVNPAEINDLDRAADGMVPAGWSWGSYLLLILGAVLAAAPAMWAFFRTRAVYAQPAAGAPVD